jgi:uncharacterized protein
MIGAFAALLIFSPVAVAEDGAKPYASPTEAYRQGNLALKDARLDEALLALEYAATHDVLGAQLKLARLYAAGRDVSKDDTKAFHYFRQIASQQAEISPSSPVAKYVGEAFLALGQYYLDGIEAMPLASDPAYAASLLRHAASYFGNAEAQYLLASLYLEGKGVEKNPTLAVNWLAISAKKQHAASQAILGELLWRGEEVRVNRARGLALLMLAQENAKGGRDMAWITELCEQTVAGADDAIRAKAVALLPRLGGEQRAAAIAKAKTEATLATPVTSEAESLPGNAPALVPNDSVPLGTGESPSTPAAPLSVGFGASASEN